MKVAIITSLLAERDVDIDSGHFFYCSVTVAVFSTRTENYFFTRDSLFFTKASQPE